MSELLGQVVFGLAIGSIYSLVAIGFSMIYRATGLLHFAHPDLMMMGGMIGWTLATRTGLPLVAVFVVAGLAVAVLSALIDRFGFRPMRTRGALLNLVIATIGWSLILVNVALIVWGTAPLAYPEAYTPRTPPTSASGRLSMMISASRAEPKAVVRISRMPTITSTLRTPSR